MSNKLSKEDEKRIEDFKNDLRNIQIKHKVVASNVLNFQSQGIIPILSIRPMTRKEIEETKQALIHTP